MEVIIQDLYHQVLLVDPGARLTTLYVLVFMSSLALVPLTPVDLCMVLSGILLRNGIVFGIEVIPLILLLTLVTDVFLFEIERKLGPKLWDIQLIERLKVKRKVTGFIEKYTKPFLKVLFVRLNPFFRPYIIVGLASLGHERKMFYGWGSLVSILYFFALIALGYFFGHHTVALVSLVLFLMALWMILAKIVAR